MTATHHRIINNSAPAFNKAPHGSGDGVPAPVISSVDSGTPGANDATITWTTDAAANSTVYWGLTTAYAGASSPVVEYPYVTSHSVDITGLTAATTYHYKVVSRRPTGIYAMSADATFETAP